VVAFTGADNSISLFSRFVCRYARARTSGMRGCASAVGVLLALVVSFVATSERGPRSVYGFATWSDAPSVQSGAAIHSLALPTRHARSAARRRSSIRRSRQTQAAPSVAYMRRSRLRRLLSRRQQQVCQRAGTTRPRHPPVLSDSH